MSALGFLSVLRAPKPFFTTLPVTRYSDGGTEIAEPKHGDSGWYDGQLLIFNEKWGRSGWYKLADYQTLKAIEERQPDWRIMPPAYFRTELPVSTTGTSTPPTPLFRTMSPKRTMPNSSGYKPWLLWQPPKWW